MKFSIRELLLVTVIMALAVGWWVDRARQADDSEGMKIEIKRLSAEVARRSKEPSWRGMDRIMDEYEEHWHKLQARERELGMKPTPAPTGTDPYPDP